MTIIMLFRSNVVVNLLGNLRAGGDTRFVFLIDTGYMWFVCLPLAFMFSMVFHLPVFWVILMPALEDVLKEISALKRFFSGNSKRYHSPAVFFTGAVEFTIDAKFSACKM
ncbi:MAG TPA: hypothetical protein PL044_07965 [Clostridiales bacterium]|nr:hypothetical protein [Clostridiales bacterium]HQH63044.1 hypothetical protein [Clostridiales bacterium]HQK73688.1 hypothetical protein [Clostridiales bacterium]